MGYARVPRTLHFHSAPWVAGTGRVVSSVWLGTVPQRISFPVSARGFAPVDACCSRLRGREISHGCCGVGKFSTEKPNSSNSRHTYSTLRPELSGRYVKTGGELAPSKTTGPALARGGTSQSMLAAAGSGRSEGAEQILSNVFYWPHWTQQQQPKTCKREKSYK